MDKIIKEKMNLIYFSIFELGISISKKVREIIIMNISFIHWITVSIIHPPVSI